MLTIAWGAFAFGAVYPWAYWPLAAAAAISGMATAYAAGIVEVRVRFLVAGILFFGLTPIAQLVSLPLTTLQQISPATVSALQQMDLQVSTGLISSHPISLDPQSTLAGFTLFLACGVLATGVALLCTRVGVRWIATPLTIIGVVMAITGIVQKATFNGKIYGFWTPIGLGNPFGPFVNRNHFAGWMMMALPVALGLLCARIDRGMEGARPGLRERVLWFGSKAASQLILSGTAAAIMALSLVFTFSRSGITAFCLAIAVTGIFVVFGVSSRLRRAAGLIYLASLFLIVLSWVGFGLIATQFQQANWSEFGDRRGAWADARQIAAMFPMTGVGFGSYGRATILYQKHDLAQHYAQAHNDYLQLAAEGGVLMTIPAAILALIIVVKCVQRFREGGSPTSWWVRAGATTGLIAIALQEIVDFSLQIPGNAVLCAVLIGIVLHRAPALPASNPERKTQHA